MSIISCSDFLLRSFPFGHPHHFTLLHIHHHYSFFSTLHTTQLSATRCCNHSMLLATISISSAYNIIQLTFSHCNIVVTLKGCSFIAYICSKNLIIFLYNFSNDESMIISNNSLYNGSVDCKAETPHVKKRHRRIKSSSVKNQDCEGNFIAVTIFYILYISYIMINLDKKCLLFE